MLDISSQFMIYFSYKQTKGQTSVDKASELINKTLRLNEIDIAVAMV